MFRLFQSLGGHANQHCRCLEIHRSVQGTQCRHIHSICPFPAIFFQALHSVFAHTLVFARYGQDKCLFRKTTHRLPVRQKLPHRHIRKPRFRFPKQDRDIVSTLFGYGFETLQDSERHIQRKSPYFSHNRRKSPIIVRRRRFERGGYVWNFPVFLNMLRGY